MMVTTIMEKEYVEYLCAASGSNRDGPACRELAHLQAVWLVAGIATEPGWGVDLAGWIAGLDKPDPQPVSLWCHAGRTPA